MNSEINEALGEIEDAVGRIKEISEEVSGVKLSDILRLHGIADKIVVGRTINNTIYYAAADVSAVLGSEKFADIRHKIVSRITDMSWPDGHGISIRTCFIIR